MRQVLSTVLATVLLFFVGCKKTDVSAEGNNAAKQPTSISNIISTPPSCDVINFTSASGLVSSVTSQNGMVVGITSHNPDFPSQPIAAMIFNSSAPDPEDYDLGSPNAIYGGPGQPSGAVSNNTALGNIIILQNFNAPYGSTIPNDDDVNIPGGYITFTFPGLIAPTSIQVIDVEANENEGGTIELLGTGGNVLATIPIPPTGSNGVATISLGSRTDVKAIRLNILGSMGFDNLQFCVPPPPTYSQCTYTQGYWKTHGPDAKGNNSNAWDVNNLNLGGHNYTDAQLLSIFNTPVKGNGLVSLAHQLIAAKLNIANGTDPTVISSTIAQADVLIGNLWIPPVGSGYLSPSSVSSLVNALTQYNEGTLTGGPSHCD